MSEHRRRCPSCGRLCTPDGYDIATTRVCCSCECGEQFMAETHREYLRGIGDKQAAEAAGRA